MSRIIVKQLPRDFGEDALRKVFAEYGNVTDVIVKRTNDGRPRCFGFVGFDSEDSADKAVTGRDSSYIGPRKIRVEKALPPKDSGLARPWSTFSKGSSAHEKANKPATEGEKETEKVEGRSAIDEVKDTIKLKVNKDTLDEFFEMKKASGKFGSWKNNEDSEGDEDKVGVDGGEGEMVESRAKSKGKSGENKKVPAHSRLTEDGEGDTEDFTDEDNSDDAPTEMPMFKDGEAAGKNRADQKQIADKIESLPFDNGRMVIWNIPKTITEEELETLCSRFGTITDISHPTDRVTGEHKSFCFIEYALSEQAQRAAESLDKQIVGGCMVRTGPAESRRGNDTEGDTEEDRFQRGMSFKERKMKKLKEEAINATMTWNTTFLRADTAATVAAGRLGVTKEAFLEADENAAVRLAVAEAQAVQDMKDMLRSWGVSTRALQGSSKSDGAVMGLKRSKTIIIAKNIPSDVTEEELRLLFERNARVNRLLYPKVTSSDGTAVYGGFALVKFVDPQEARKAFTFAAFRKMGAARAPLYLEWAPTAENDKQQPVEDKKTVPETPEVPKPLKQTTQETESTKAGVNTKVSTKSDTVDDRGTTNTNTHTNTDTGTDTDTDTHRDNTQDSGVSGVTTASSCIYVKNLSFKTDDTDLRRAVLGLGVVRESDVASVSIAKNTKTGKSRGFGFVQLVSSASASTSTLVARLNGCEVDGHELVAKISEHAQITRLDSSSLDAVPSGVGGNRKLLVRNIPFEAEQKQLKTLFETYGQVVNLRLPKKFDGSSRGFCFVEFTGRDEAERAKEALGSVHFLGRHLVIEWAKEESVSGEAPEPDRKKAPR